MLRLRLGQRLLRARRRLFEGFHLRRVLRILCRQSLFPIGLSFLRSFRQLFTVITLSLVRSFVRSLGMRLLLLSWNVFFIDVPLNAIYRPHVATNSLNHYLELRT